MSDFVSGKILEFILNNVETVGITVTNHSGINRALSEKESKTRHKISIKGKSFVADFDIDFLGHDCDFRGGKRDATLDFHLTDKTKKASEAFADLTTVLSDQYTSDQLNIVAENKGFHEFARHLELPKKHGINLLTSLNHGERKALDYYVHNYPLKREFLILDEMMKISLIKFENIEIDSELLSLIKKYFLELVGTEGTSFTGLKFTNCRINKSCDWTILKGCNIEIRDSNVNLDDFEYSCNSFSFEECTISHSRFIRLQSKQIRFSDCKIDMPRLFLTATANNLEKFTFDANYDIERQLDNLKYFAPNLKHLELGKTDFSRSGKIRDITFFSGFKSLTNINLIGFGYEHQFYMCVEFINPVKTAERYTNCKDTSAPFYGYEYVPFDGYEDLCEKQRKFEEDGTSSKKLYAEELYNLEMVRALRINSLCRTIYNARDHITQEEMLKLLYNYEGYVKSDEFLKNDGFYEYYTDTNGLVLHEYEHEWFMPENDIQLDWPYFNRPHEILLDGGLHEIKWRQAVGFAINSVTGIPISLHIRRQLPQIHERRERTEEEREFFRLEHNTASALLSLARQYKEWAEARTDDAPFVVPYTLFAGAITSEFLEQKFPNLTYLIGQIKACEARHGREIHQTSPLKEESSNLKRSIIGQIESHLGVLTVPEVVFLMTRIEHSESKSRMLKYQMYNSILSKAVTKFDFSGISDKSITKKIGQGIIDKINRLSIINYCLRELGKAYSETPKIIIDDETASELFHLANHVIEKRHH